MIFALTLTGVGESNAYGQTPFFENTYKHYNGSPDAFWDGYDSSNQVTYSLSIKTAAFKKAALDILNVYGLGFSQNHYSVKKCSISIESEASHISKNLLKLYNSRENRKALKLRDGDLNYLKLKIELWSDELSFNLSVGNIIYIGNSEKYLTKTHYNPELLNSIIISDIRALASKLYKEKYPFEFFDCSKIG